VTPQISKVYTHYAATILFFFFGFKTLYDTFTAQEVRAVRAAWGLAASVGIGGGHGTAMQAASEGSSRRRARVGA
jgi:hypothetical protein